MPNILIGCTGSVATIKLPLLLENIFKQEYASSSQNVKIKVVVTKYAQHFFSLNEIQEGVEVITDTAEWSTWNKRGDPVLHIELTKWADIFVIAPLDANSLGKIASGICDNLLTCIVRAWDMSKPLIFCPAMNTKMFNHPITVSQINILQSWGYHLIPTVEKTLVCGDTGDGAMAEVSTIVSYIKSLL